MRCIHYFGGPYNGDVADERACPMEPETNIRLLGPQRDEAYEEIGDCAFYMGPLTAFDFERPFNQDIY